MTASDAHVIALARHAREAALDVLYQAYRTRIFTFLLRLTGDADAADDLTQDTFIKAHRGLRTLADDHRLLPWLYRIANNSAIDAARRHKRIPWIRLSVLVESGQEPHAPDGHGRVVERDEVSRMLKSIPLENAAALLLHALEGYSYKEIAAIQGCTMTAVRSRIARARAGLREAYATTEAARSSSL
jgi:RNA polymerase sigma-70 factor (ECF subfamily)